MESREQHYCQRGCELPRRQRLKQPNPWPGVDGGRKKGGGAKTRFLSSICPVRSPAPLKGAGPPSWGRQRPVLGTGHCARSRDRIQGGRPPYGRPTAPCDESKARRGLHPAGHRLAQRGLHPLGPRLTRWGQHPPGRPLGGLALDRRPREQNGAGERRANAPPKIPTGDRTEETGSSPFEKMGRENGEGIRPRGTGRPS